MVYKYDGKWKLHVVIEDDGVRRIVIDDGVKQDGFVHFEAITNNHENIKIDNPLKGKKFISIGSIAAILNYVIAAIIDNDIYLGISVALGIIWFIYVRYLSNKKSKYLKLTTNEDSQIILFNNSEGVDFMQKIYEHRNIYLKEKYTKNLFEWNIDFVRFLRNLEVISEVEFNDYKSELKVADKKTAGFI